MRDFDSGRMMIVWEQAITPERPARRSGDFVDVPMVWSSQSVHRFTHQRAVLFVVICTVLVFAAVFLGRKLRPIQPPAASDVESEPAKEAYLLRRSFFQTRLTESGPASGDYLVENPPADVEEITFMSHGLQLKACFCKPDTEREQHPAVIWFHSGHTFGASDFEEARVFAEAGFAVMTPMLRGENGNPGNFELLCGEVDDAANAVHWLANRSDIDGEHIYCFGHSIGGAVSAMLSKQ